MSNLVAASVLPQTHFVYRRELHNLLVYLSGLVGDRVMLQSLFSINHRDLDVLLVRYLEYIFSLGYAVSKAHTTVAAVTFHVPEVKTHLYLTERALKGFSKLRPSKPRSVVPAGLARYLFSLFYKKFGVGHGVFCSPSF